MNQYNVPNTGINNQLPSMTTPVSNYGTMQPANQAFVNQIQNSIVWVETEEEAKTWMVGPNNRVFIFVKDNEVLYIKEKNSDGRPLKTEIYDLSKRQVLDDGASIDLGNYVKKEDVSKMIDAAVERALSKSKSSYSQNYSKQKSQMKRKEGNYRSRDEEEEEEEYYE